MRKVYRISVRNASNNNQRELMYGEYTSRKRAQEMCNKINLLDAEREAYVVAKER